VEDQTGPPRVVLRRGKEHGAVTHGVAALAHQCEEATAVAEPPPAVVVHPQPQLVVLCVGLDDVSGGSK
jgi:hypothetical protein